MNKTLRIVLIVAAVIIVASGLLLTGFVAGRVSARIGNPLAANAWQAGGGEAPFFMGRMMGGGMFSRMGRMMGGGMFSRMGRMMGGALPDNSSGGCPFYNQEKPDGSRMGPGMMNPEWWTR